MTAQNTAEQRPYSVVKSTYLWILVALITTIIVVGIFVIELTRNYAEAHARRELTLRTNVAAANISPDLVRPLSGSAQDLDSQAYQLIKQQLVAIKQAAAEDVRFVYLMRQTGSDIMFLVDAEPVDSEDYSPPGQVYPNPSQELRRIFADGQSFVEGPIVDEWGAWVSGHAAIKDRETGAVVAIIGIDINADRWNEFITIYHWGGLSITMLLLALAVVYFVALWRIGMADKRRLLAVDELERTVEELKDANRELDAFSYSVSHDLRAPLRHVAGFSQIISDECRNNLSAECLHALDRMLNGVKKMDALIDGLLGLSRINRQELKAGEHNFSAIARDVVEQFQQADRDRNCEVIIHDDMRGRADSRLLRVVFENLLGNAWKYTRYAEKPRIEAGSYREGKNTIYFVSDNGVGFNSQYSDRVFDAFQRLHHPEEFEGLGIGLSTVSRIIRRHKGRVWAHGKENEGATFYFTLGL